VKNWLGGFVQTRKDLLEEKIMIVDEFCVDVRREGILEEPGIDGREVEELMKIFGELEKTFRELLG
jgi:hypothetical protein